MEDVIEKPFILCFGNDKRINLDKMADLIRKDKPFDINDIKKYGSDYFYVENIDKIYYVATIAWWYGTYDRIEKLFGSLKEDQTLNLNKLAKLSYTILDNFIEMISKAVSQNYTTSEGDLEFSLLLDDIEDNTYYFKRY